MKTREYKFKLVNELNELCSLFAADPERAYQYKEIHPKNLKYPEKLIDDCINYLRV